MELMPRITRAQSMDVLSSQANLAGYKAVLDAAAEYGRAMPMMMTAAGTVSGRARASSWARALPACRPSPPRAARRRGHRHRRAPGRQGAGGKPRAASSSPSRTRSSSRPRPPAATPRKCRRIPGQAGRADRRNIAKQDIVITTALIPGRPAPKLITAMVASDEAGLGDRRSRGRARRQLRTVGAGQVVEKNGVKIVGQNMPSRLAASASALYARTSTTSSRRWSTRRPSTIAVNWEDEIIGDDLHPRRQGRASGPGRRRRLLRRRRRTSRPRAGAATERRTAEDDVHEAAKPSLNARRRSPTRRAISNEVALTGGRGQPPHRPRAPARAIRRWSSASRSSCWRSSSATTWSGR
jgi:hypothetical protein